MQIPVSIAAVTAMATTIPMRNTNRQLHGTSNPKQVSLQMGSGQASAIEAMHALVDLIRGKAPSREPTITLLPRPGATPCASSLTHASSSPSLTEGSPMPSLQEPMPNTVLPPSGVPAQPAALPPLMLPPLPHVNDKAKSSLNDKAKSEEQSVLTAAELLKQELDKAKDKALKATDADESDASMEEIVPKKEEAKGKGKDADSPKTSSEEVQKKGKAKQKPRLHARARLTRSAKSRPHLRAKLQRSAKPRPHLRAKFKRSAKRATRGRRIWPHAGMLASLRHFSRSSRPVVLAADGGPFALGLAGHFVSMSCSFWRAVFFSADVNSCGLIRRWYLN